MSSEGTTNDPSLPPTWEALVRRIAREVAVEVVESAEMWMFDFRTTYTFRVPRGEETSAQPAGHGLANAANMRDPPTGPRPEVGPPSGEDDATAQFLYCGRCGFELTERIRAYGDARVREAIEGVAYVYEGWSGPAKEVLEYMRAELDLQKACRK